MDLLASVPESSFDVTRLVNATSTEEDIQPLSAGGSCASQAEMLVFFVSEVAIGHNYELAKPGTTQ